MIRFLDICIALLGLTVGLPAFLIIAVIGLFDTGSPVFFQQRVGQYKRPFTLIKFRTMNVDAESVATHLADSNSVTDFGRFLRRTKLDELPQLWNVLKGEMSLVGPRPGLFNQHELTAAREKLGVFNVRPGITGLAQVSGIDMSRPELLAKVDQQMIETLSLKSYFHYIVLTALGKGAGDRIQQ